MTQPVPSILRTFLFAPGNHPRRVEKALALGADAVILDLEDAVAMAEKASTRKTVLEALSRPRKCKGYVRVNALSTPWCLGDLMELVRPGVEGIVLPKVESASDLRTADWLIGNLERERGLPPGAIDLMPVIETAAGFAHLDHILDLRALTEHPGGRRVKRLSFGAGDFTNDVGMTWTPGEEELAGLRIHLIVASRAAGLEPPIDTVWIHLKDADAMRRSVERSLRMGFQGRLCTHPDQVSVVNEIFTPSAAEIERAERVVDAFRQAEAAGLAAIQVDGVFVDYPIVHRAQRILATFAAIRERKTAI
jgi:citrate lyase subunit beta/citryl-CoA lyase